MGHFKYLILALTLSLSGNAEGQNNEQPSIKSLVEARRYVFVAESANPLRGRTIFLSPGYTFSVSPDTVESHLPYYGRAYQAPMNPSDAGLNFTSTDFTYTVKEKKNRWEVFIKTKGTGTSQINLSIASNGSASLRVTSIDRESISFQGRVKQK